MDRNPNLPFVSTRGYLSGALAALLERTAERVADGVRSPATLGMQRAHVAWLLERLADVPLAELTEPLVEAFARAERAGRRGRPIGTVTLRKRLSTLRSALRLAYRRGELERVPAFPELPARARPRRLFLRSFAEYSALYASLPRHRAEWMALCLWTGQHAGDVERMTWVDVRVHGPAPWMLIRNTKGSRTEGLRVPMPRPLVTVLREKLAREPPGSFDEPIVRPWPSRGHTLADHARRLGLLVRNAIDLRHTAASWMVRKQGITPAVLAFLGHSSPAMAARVYAHAMPLQLGEAIRDLESIADEEEAA
jgi:integrase